MKVKSLIFIVILLISAISIMNFYSYLLYDGVGGDIEKLSSGKQDFIEVVLIIDYFIALFFYFSTLILALHKIF
ncbi:hypothetical protein Pecwa_1711 [Pectobacterium parmentieri WPP163]|nr:hypothetical protein Pecwa_1711 [Pectobacterium parmentieri WPP163]